MSMGGKVTGAADSHTGWCMSSSVSVLCVVNPINPFEYPLAATCLSIRRTRTSDLVERCRSFALKLGWSSPCTCASH